MVLIVAIIALSWWQSVSDITLCIVTQSSRRPNFDRWVGRTDGLGLCCGHAD